MVTKFRNNTVLNYCVLKKNYYLFVKIINGFIVKLDKS